MVRNEFERGENSPVLRALQADAAGDLSTGTTTATRRSARSPTSRARRSSGCRPSTRTTTSRTTRCWWSPGKFDEPKTLELIKNSFGTIPKPTRKLQRTYTREPQQDGERQVTLRRTGDVQVVSCMFRSARRLAPGQRRARPCSALLLVDEPAGRLYKALVESKKAASVSGSVSGFAEAGIVGFTAEVRQEQSLADAQAAMLQVLDEPRKEAADRGGSDARADAPAEGLRDVAEAVGPPRAALERVDRAWATGGSRFFERDQLEKVTPADVARVAAHYFKPSNRTIGLFIPEKNADRAAIPEAPDLTALLKDYKGRPPIAQGEDFEASPENIEKRTTRGATGATG